MLARCHRRRIFSLIQPRFVFIGSPKDGSNCCFYCIYGKSDRGRSKRNGIFPNPTPATIRKNCQVSKEIDRPSSVSETLVFGILSVSKLNADLGKFSAIILRHVCPPPPLSLYMKEAECHQHGHMDFAVYFNLSSYAQSSIPGS